jgi:hypothetical protein
MFRSMIERDVSKWVRRNRKAASLTGVAYRADGSWVRVHMTDLSYDGCRLLTDNQLGIGEALTLAMPRMQHLAVQVRWVKDGEAGVRFIHGNGVDERRARIGV